LAIVGVDTRKKKEKKKTGEEGKDIDYFVSKPSG